MTMLAILDAEQIRTQGCGIVETDALIFADGDGLRVVQLLRNYGYAARMD
jgi:hypothetical protein